MFFAEIAGHLPCRTCSAHGPPLFISVPRLWLKFQQGVFAKMPPAKLEPLARSIPILGKHRRQEGTLKGLGLDAVLHGRQWLGAAAARS